MNDTSPSLNIAIVGASGQVGRRIVAEARGRGHRVTAMARHVPANDHAVDHVVWLERDIASAPDLASVFAEHDVVISAIRPDNGREAMLVNLTAAVVRAAQEASIRFVIIGGAAPLRLPDQPEFTVLTAPGLLPPSVVPIATASQHQYEWTRSRLGRNGTLLCPPASLVPGHRTGTYELGTDTLVGEVQGPWEISLEDFAVAAVDEAEQARHSGRAFTVGAAR